MKNITVLIALTIVFHFSCLGQTDEVFDVFSLTELYCNGNEKYEFGDNLKRLFPVNTYIMWITKGNQHSFYGIIPDTLDPEKNELFAVANVQLIDCAQAKDVIFTEDCPKFCAQGKIVAPIYGEQYAKYLSLEKLRPLVEGDPYQYICLTFYFEPLNNQWKMLQMYGKSIKFDHKIP